MHTNRTIILIDNNTGKLRKFYNHLIFRSYPVEIFNSANQALNYVCEKPVSIVISQVMLLDSDITQLEQDLRKLRYMGPIVAVLDDPLAEKAVEALNYHYRYYFKDLKNIEDNEKLIQLIYEDNPQEPLENSPNVVWQESYELVIPSLPQYIERVITYFLKKTASFKGLSNQITSFRLSISEALANAFEHGNHFDFHKKVKITLQINQIRMMITIQDEGEGFDFQKNTKTFKELNEQYKDRGRGLLIIHKAMDEVLFEEPGNKMIMIKNFKEM